MTTAEQMSLPDKFTIHLERGKAGLWYATSPEVKGLLVAARTIDGALQAVPKALAHPMTRANGPRRGQKESGDVDW